MVQHIHFRHAWSAAVFFFCAALVLANGIHYVLFRLIRHKERDSKGWGGRLRKHLAKPARTIFLLTCLMFVLPVIPNLPDWIEIMLRRSFVIAIVVAFGWLLVGCIYVVQDVILQRYDLGTANNIKARRVHTQFQLFRRIAIFFVVVIDAGLLLWTFDDPRIWHYGSGLLASAGLASLVLATAAKSTASNLLAGMQIALTQPIRIDDVVTVQGEWGHIEEINSVYVVVKLWDLRRMIVPLSFFIENSFQNWTRESADIMGTAFLYVDYAVPVEALREQLNRIVHASPLWDEQVCALQVTNLTDKSMEIRCLMSSRNSTENFELRCIVREKMTAWIQTNYPNTFPTNRISRERTGAGEN